MKKIIWTLGTAVLTASMAFAVACGPKISGPKDVPKSGIALEQDESKIVARRQISKDVIAKTKLQVLTGLDRNHDGKNNLILHGYEYQAPQGSSDTSYPLRDNSPANYAGDKLECLPTTIYNGVVDVLEEATLGTSNIGSIADELGVNNLQAMVGQRNAVTAYILDNEFYIEFYQLKLSPTNELKFEKDYIVDSDIAEMQLVETQPYGAWMARVKFFDGTTDNPQWRWGESHNSNYGILGYPLYEVSNVFSQLGVSSMPVKDGSIHEITYNHNA